MEAGLTDHGWTEELLVARSRYLGQLWNVLLRAIETDSQLTDHLTHVAGLDFRVLTRAVLAQR